MVATNSEHLGDFVEMDWFEYFVSPDVVCFVSPDVVDTLWMCLEFGVVWQSTSVIKFLLELSGLENWQWSIDIDWNRVLREKTVWVRKSWFILMISFV